MALVRLVVVIAELLIPILLSAKYGIGAGVACAALYLCFAMDIALKEMIDAKKEEEKS